MKCLIVYDSYFGNTEAVATQLGNTVTDHVVVSHVKDVTLDGPYDLIVIGSPTRAFRATTPIMTFIRKLPKDIATHVAVFDTRINPNGDIPKFLKFLMGSFGFAMEKMAKKLNKKHHNWVLDSKAFIVLESEGPLDDTELHNATEWMKDLIFKVEHN